MSIYIPILLFFLLLGLNVPIAFAISFTTLITMLFTIDMGPALTTMAQRMATGIDSFALLAIPFFILSGYIMGQGGMAKRLIDATKALIGMIPGGLAFTNIVSCMLFGSISGSAVAASSAIGSFMIPEMKKAGYSRAFSSAVTVAGSTTGLLIPPSNVLIVYAVASGGASIAALFAAGYVPGILLGLALMVVCAVYAKAKNFPVEKPLPFMDIVQKLAAAFPAILLIVIIIGGILKGVFTATEAGGIAVIYSLLLSAGIYREIGVSECKGILIRAAQTTGIVMLLIAASSAMGWILAYENIPQMVAQSLIGLSENPIIILLLINLILLLVGAFIDITPAVLIFTPIFMPVAIKMGMSPEHFGIMMVLNLSIGLCTPPVGSVLFVGASVGGVSMTKMIRPLLPMYLAMFVTLMLVTYVPWMSEALPKALGLLK